MPRIYVEFSKLNSMRNYCESVASKIDVIQSDFQQIVRQLDWDIRYESDINSTAAKISKRLEQYSRMLGSYQHFIEVAYNEYIKLDRYQKGETLNDFFRMEPVDIHLVGPGGANLFETGNIIFTEKIKNYFSDVEEERELLSTIKSLLEGADKLGNKDEAGVLKDVISYIQNAVSFFNEDKKGLIGASNWCDLAESSIGLWTGMYDYFRNMYDGVKSGFFGDIAQKNVKILGLSSGFLGLTASILSASQGLNEKQWKSAVADYVDCGKDVLSVISSAYSLKHIGDVKSLTEIKAGPWNALNIYSATGESIIQSISQGFRSVEKYNSDGQWNLGDTGATGIDISIAGVYAISHKLTWGLDDLVFSVIDSATGGNEKNNMNYFEKSAEGYKILANKCGEAIGNWWLSLVT